MLEDSFWETLSKGHTASTYQSSFDHHLTGKSFDEDFTQVRELTEAGRRMGALRLPVPAGTMVVFAGDLGSMLSMTNPPKKGMPGEVVPVKSAGGEVTSHEGMVFVKWADGVFRQVHSEYLRLAKFPKGEETTVEEVSKVVGPAFKKMNENPPPEVVETKEKMQGKKASSEVNPYSLRVNYAQFKKYYFEGEPVSDRIAKEFWDDFRYAFKGSLARYRTETTSKSVMGSSRRKAKTNPFLAQVKEPGIPGLQGLWYIKVIGPEGEYVWLDNPGMPPVFVPTINATFKRSSPKSIRLYATEQAAEQALPQAKDYVLRYMSGDPELSKSANKIRVSSVGDLTQFLKTADGKLVHKSTKDLWAFNKDADGSLIVERLYTDSGKPLKA